jgi:hypothetical protein
LHSSTALSGERLQWTGAVNEVEGAAGGGLVPWALIAGLGTDTEIGATGFATYVATQDYTLRTAGASLGLYDRVEISYARQSFDAGSVLPGLTLGSDNVGIKVRLMGDAVFAPDTWLPQVSVGAMWKKTVEFNVIPKALGADSGKDLDFYVAATKLYFAAIAGRNILVDVTLRRTRADQFGLLGFGGDRGGHHLEPEISAALFLSDEWLMGAEYRRKPNDLGVFREDAAGDVFVGYSPFKNLSLIAAWADLGHIAGKQSQHGTYLSFWLGY